jgi:hypothetical protein
MLREWFLRAVHEWRRPRAKDHAALLGDSGWSLLVAKTAKPGRAPACVPACLPACPPACVPSTAAARKLDPPL